MTPLAAILAAICRHYPWGLSRSRLVKTAFLVDWESARRRGRPASDATWYWREAGPTTDNIDKILEGPPFTIIRGRTATGDPFELITVSKRYRPWVPRETVRLMKQVLDRYGAMNTRDFLQVVYSTYPLLASRPGDELNLTRFADVERRMAAVAGGAV